jgi:hypothetical protein
MEDSMNKFIGFLTSTFGALAAMSVFFPFANKLADIICVNNNFEVEATTLTSIGCAFTVLLVFARGANGNRGIILPLVAILGTFASIWVSITDKTWCSTQNSIITYVGAFVLTTLAFSSLGALIYFRQNLDLVKQEQEHRYLVDSSHSSRPRSFYINLPGLGGSAFNFIKFLVYWLIYLGLPILIWAIVVRVEPRTAEDLKVLSQAEDGRTWIIIISIYAVGYVVLTLRDAWKRAFDSWHSKNHLLLLMIIDIGLLLALFII